MVTQRIFAAAALSLLFLAAGCTESGDSTDTESTDQAAAKTETGMNTDETRAIRQQDDTNPFFTESDLPYHMPPFDEIENEHYQPALEKGMEQQIAQVEKIANNPEPPTFENTIVALEESGELLDRVRPVFSNMTSAHTNDALQELSLIHI